MGIHDLFPLLRRAAAPAFVPLDEWQRGRGDVGASPPLRVAVDAPIFMYKLGYGVGFGDSLPRRFLHLAEQLQARGLSPTFVFDGAPLPLKSEEQARRQEAHTKQRAAQCSRLAAECVDEDMEVERGPSAPMKPSSEDFVAVRSALEAAGWPCVTAKHEAEACCASLCRAGAADAVVTEDSDAVAYLAPAVITRWGSGAEQVVLADRAAQLLQLTHEQFQDLCVLLGNDFNPRVPGVGPVKALSFLRQRGSLDGVLAWGKQQTKAAALAALGEETQSRMRHCRVVFQTCCHESGSPARLADQGSTCT